VVVGLKVRRRALRNILVQVSPLLLCSWLRCPVLLVYCRLISRFLVRTVGYDVALLAAIITGRIGVAIRSAGGRGCIRVRNFPSPMSAKMFGRPGAVSAVAVSAVAPSLAHGHIPLCYMCFCGLAAGFFVNGKEFLFDVIEGVDSTTVTFQVV